MIIDVDPGIDDAMAIFYAVRRPALKLEALTTTFGNTDTAIATDNALRVLELLGRPDIPVARGVERSFIHPYVRRADHVHGSNAIGDIELPEPKIRPTDEHASDLIIRMAKESPGEITLCPVGPVTNVALALVKAPEIAKLLRKIVIMGSTIFHPGIHGPQAPMVDANFANDPEAAHIVLRSGANITLVGMDVTMTTLFSTKMIDEVAREGDKAAKTLMRMTEFYLRAYKGMYPGIAGCGLHDPACGCSRGRSKPSQNGAHVRRRGAARRTHPRTDDRRPATDRRRTAQCRRLHGHRPPALFGELPGRDQRTVSAAIPGASMRTRCRAACRSRRGVKSDRQPAVISSIRPSTLTLLLPSPPIVLIAARREFGGDD
jgi:purine nucleosidase